MSKIEDGGPAFPVAYSNEGDGPTVMPSEGMTLRQYAAIKLRVPNSGTDWLDEMIIASLRDKLAGSVIPTLTSDYCEQAGIIGFDENWMTGVALDAYEMADAMIKAREVKNEQP